MSINLPFDIVERIIDILSQDDPHLSTTKACSFVCRSFLRICRRHIFACIHLNEQPELNEQHPTIPQSTHTIPKLLKLLDMSPVISKNIRRFRYSFLQQDASFLADGDTFKRLKHVQYLHIKAGSQKLSWDALQPALCHLIKLPTLTYMKLVRITDFSVTDLAFCANLEELRLEIVSFSIPSSPIPTSPLRLRTLSFKGCRASDISDVLSVKCVANKRILAVSELRCLMVRVTTAEDCITVQNILCNCNNLISLDILSINTDAATQNFNVIDFFNLPTVLRHLKVSIMVYLPRVGTRAPSRYSGFTTELAKLAYNNNLETIDANIFIGMHSNFEVGAEWERLDEVLEQPGHAWPELKRVSLAICLITIYEFDEERAHRCLDFLREMSKTQFRRLSSSRSLDFQFSVRRV